MNQMSVQLFRLISKLMKVGNMRTGKGVSVAIIDSGIDTNHPDLQGKSKNRSKQKPIINALFSSHPKRAIPPDTARLARELFRSIAPDADFYSIKVLGAGGLGDGQAFLAGFEYAIKNRYRIINLVWERLSRNFSSPLHDLLDRAYQAGCIVVAAANNLPQPSFPSVFSSSLISVSKNEETDPFNFGFQYGEIIELDRARRKYPHGLAG